MMDSLPYRNDAAMVLRRLIRSLPTRQGVLGVATCDKGLPAMMMALAAMHDLPCVLVPGGVTLPPSDGEDAGKVQTIGARFAHGELTLEQAAELGCRACGSRPAAAASSWARRPRPGGRRGPGPDAAALRPGPLRPADLARHGPPLRPRRRPAADEQDLTIKHILTPAALRNAMAVHAAFGGSTNLLLHIPAIAYHAGLRRPTVDDWNAVNRQVPRLVDALPNGPVGHPTVRVFLAGGVPEVMLHLRRLGLLDSNAPDRHRRDRWARCSSGGRTPSAAPGCGKRLRSKTASIPTT